MIIVIEDDNVNDYRNQIEKIDDHYVINHISHTIFTSLDYKRGSSLTNQIVVTYSYLIVAEHKEK